MHGLRQTPPSGPSWKQPTPSVAQSPTVEHEGGSPFCVEHTGVLEFPCTVHFIPTGHPEAAIGHPRHPESLPLTQFAVPVVD